MRMCADRAVHNEAILHLILSYTMYRWSAFEGGNSEAERKALSHKIKGLKLINTKLTDAVAGIGDFNIQSALLMTAIEVGHQPSSSHTF